MPLGPGSMTTPASCAPGMDWEPSLVPSGISTQNGSVWPHFFRSMSMPGETLTPSGGAEPVDRVATVLRLKAWPVGAAGNE